MNNSRRLFKTKETVFWKGAVVLVIGFVLFAYCYSAIQNLKDSEDLSDSYGLARNWNIAHLLQPISLGMIVLSAIILAYGSWAKK